MERYIPEPPKPVLLQEEIMVQYPAAAHSEPYAAEIIRVVWSVTTKVTE